MQRCERHRQRNRAAVRVRDDPGVLVRTLAIHLGHDERDTCLEPESRRLVHAERTGSCCERDELATDLGADREEADVEVAGAQRRGRRLLYLEVPEPPAGGTPRRERADVGVSAIDQVLKRHLPDRARSADDADTEVGVDHRPVYESDEKEPKKTLNRLTRRPAGSVGAI